MLATAHSLSSVIELHLADDTADIEDRLTDAVTTTAVEDKTHRTFATEGSVRVDTLTAVTDTRHNVTLVQIFTFRSTSRPTWTQFVKFSCVNEY